MAVAVAVAVVVAVAVALAVAGDVAQAVATRKRCLSRLRRTPTSRNYVEKPYVKPSLLEAIWSGQTPTRQKKMRFVRVKR